MPKDQSDPMPPVGGRRQRVPADRIRQLWLAARVPRRYLKPVELSEIFKASEGKAEVVLAEISEAMQNKEPVLLLANPCLPTVCQLLAELIRSACCDGESALWLPDYAAQQRWDEARPDGTGPRLLVVVLDRVSSGPFSAVDRAITVAVARYHNALQSILVIPPQSLAYGAAKRHGFTEYPWRVIAWDAANHCTSPETHDTEEESDGRTPAARDAASQADNRGAGVDTKRKRGRRTKGAPVPKAGAQPNPTPADGGGRDVAAPRGGDDAAG